MTIQSTTQSEFALEQGLIEQLERMEYARVCIDDEAAMLARIEKRRADAIAAGDAVRKDDDPEVFKERLSKYREETAPVSGFYDTSGRRQTVDGMRPIEEVAAQIDAILAG